MKARSMPVAPKPPALPRILGYGGLLPQAFAIAVLLIGPPSWHFAALFLGFAYAALILSFLGGMWWGLAAGKPSGDVRWVWLAAVMPSLIALATAVPWMIGAAAPRLSLLVLGLSLLVSLLIDRRLATDGLAPPWWMSLRIPLSVGLGGLTLAMAALTASIGMTGQG